MCRYSNVDSYPASMSKTKNESSRSIDLLGCIKDVTHARLISTLHDRRFLRQINFASENLFQLAFHVNNVEQAPRGVRFKGCEHINIAGGTKIVAEDRSEEREFGELTLKILSDIVSTL